MRCCPAVCLMAVVLAVFFSVFAWAEAPIGEPLQIELLPVVTAGLDHPLYVTHAGDGSKRLFIVEQGGRIRVLEQGALAPLPFLDITDRVRSGGEQGLLGVAF